MAQLKDVAATLDPRFVVGSFVLGASGFPLSVLFGQIPAIWSESTDLNEKEALGAAILGANDADRHGRAIALFVTPFCCRRSPSSHDRTFATKNLTGGPEQ